MKQRVAARLLLASCTLALGLGLGTATAVDRVLALQHPTIQLRSPGDAEGRLDPGVHHLFVVRRLEDPGGDRSEPSCTVSDVRTGARAGAAAAAAGGFAAVRVEQSGRHKVSCASSQPVTVKVDHHAEGLGAYAGAVGRGLLLALLLTFLAALLAARALVTARRLADPA